MIKPVKIVFLLFFLANLSYTPSHNDKLQRHPPIVFLTWQNQDTSHHLTINLVSKDRPEQLSVQIKPIDLTNETFQPSDFHSQTVSVADESFWLARFSINNLNPGRPYQFSIMNRERIVLYQGKFQTLPLASQEIRFVVGGDMGTNPRLIPLLKAAASQDPHFAIIGGDIAYANGRAKNSDKWLSWLSYWHEHMKTTKGFLIPMIVAIGNHEANLSIYKDKKAPFYFDLFSQTDKPQTYFVRDIASDLQLLILDTSHVNSHFGEQKDWLEKQLSSQYGKKLQIAAYHIPLYPSHRSYENPLSYLGRKYWLPLFDRYQLVAAFEHHDHTLKRTHPMKDNKIDPSGTVYFGDGCWGKSPRTAEKRWYLDHFDEKDHFWFVRYQEKTLDFKAMSTAYEILDSYQINKTTF